ncbi:MAG: mechanosensitive ion channel family protein [Candidatus Porifericomitaceae bacterium WSBS_2022_MAG_OTU9]
METVEIITQAQIITEALTVLAAGSGLAVLWYLLVCVVMKKKYSSQNTTILGVVLGSLYYPLLVYILGKTALYSGFIVNQHINIGLEVLLVPAGYLLKLGCIIFAVLLFVRHLGVYIGISLDRRVQKLEKERIDKVVNVATRVVQFVLLLMAVLIVMDHFGFNITSIVALGSVSGLVLGLAAKDILSNVLGRITLYMEKPFAPGDHIICADVEGIAKKLKWRITEVQTFDRHMVYVPNNLFINNPVHNHARRNNRRINEIIGVRYDDSNILAKIVENVENMLIEHPGVDENDTMVVKLVGFGSSSLDFMVYALMHETDWAKAIGVRHDVFLKIIDIVGAAGAEFAFPTRTLHLANGETAAAQVKSVK